MYKDRFSRSNYKRWDEFRQGFRDFRGNSNNVHFKKIFSDWPFGGKNFHLTKNWIEGLNLLVKVFQKYQRKTSRIFYPNIMPDIALLQRFIQGKNKIDPPPDRDSYVKQLITMFFRFVFRRSINRWQLFYTAVKFILR